jgi:hypothetical protein
MTTEEKHECRHNNYMHYSCGENCLKCKFSKEHVLTFNEGYKAGFHKCNAEHSSAM